MTGAFRSVKRFVAKSKNILNVKYFKYELRKNLLPMIVISTLATVFYLANILNENFERAFYSYEGGGYTVYPPSAIGIPLVILAILCCIIPVMMFSFKMSSKQTDLYYSLPITREKLYLVKSLVGLIEVLVPFTVMFWLGFLFIATRPNDLILTWYPVVYFLAALFAILIFGINTFVFTRANSIVDGLVFIGFYACAIPVLIGCLWNAVYAVNSYETNLFLILIKPNDYFIFSPFSEMFNRFDNLIVDAEKISYSYLDGGKLIYYVPISWICYPLVGVLGALSWTGLFLTARNEKAENAERISDNMFGYRVMIPYYSIGLMSLFTIQSIFYSVLIPIVSVVSYIIFRRSFKLKKEDAIILVSSVIVGVILRSIIGG